MARIRSVTPAFFKHEGLGELSALHRLLFIGLWCHADKAGRLEDRPKRLKVEILPYDDADIDLLLNELEDKGFISRYAVGAQQCIVIPKFLKHQRPRRDEHQSVLPAPPGSGEPVTMELPARDSIATEPSLSSDGDVDTQRVGGRKVGGRKVGTPAEAPPAPRLTRADKAPESPIRRLQLRYAEMLALNLGVENPELNWEKVGSIFKMALEKFDEPTVRNVLEKFMLDRDPFLVRQAWPIGLFRPRFNQYLPKPQAVTEAPSTAEDEHAALEAAAARPGVGLMHRKQPA